MESKQPSPPAAWWLRLVGVLLLTFAFGFLYLPATPDLLGVPLATLGLACMIAGVVMQLLRKA